MTILPRTLHWSTALAIALATPGLATATELKVAVPTAMTGPFVFAAVPQMNGVKLAVAQLEQQNFFGDDVTIEYIYEDTAGEKNQATTLITKYAKYDKVDLILGPTSSVESFASLPVAQEAGVPALTNASADVSVIGEWIFKATSTPVTIMSALAEYALAELAPKKVAYINNRDNDAYIAQMNGLKTKFEAAGAETIAADTIVGTDTDFTALATKLASLDIDTLVVSTTAEVSANFIIQARMAGLSPDVRILGTPSMASVKFLEVGGAAVEGAIFVTDYFFDSPSELNQTFIAEYTEMFGEAPDIFAALGYTQMMEGAHGIKAAAPDYTPEGIRAGLAAIKDMPTILGDGLLTITEGRTPTYGGYVLTVKDGEFVLF